MAKFYGKIGYGVTEEVKPGVWKNQFVEKDIVGEFLKNTRQLQGSDKVNDDININNLVSIVADAYVKCHMNAIKYVRDIMTGVAWKVTNIEVQYPRLILTLGGEYNNAQ